MKKQKNIIILIIILILLFVSGIVIFTINNPKKEENKNVVNLENINSAETIEELKNETGAEGNAQIYEVQTEYDGRKVLAVKANVQYKVALAGMLKGTVPTYKELDEIITNKAPQNNGIWVENKSREKVTKFLSQNTKLNSKYYIDDNGYIKIKDKNIQNDVDKKVEKLINGNKQYIIDISSVCYIVDDITGEILDYNFEKMDKYQTYQYYQDENMMILFVNENSNKQLSEDEIFESLLELVLE